MAKRQSFTVKIDFSEAKNVGVPAIRVPAVRYIFLFRFKKQNKKDAAAIRAMGKIFLIFADFVKSFRTLWLNTGNEKD